MYVNNSSCLRLWDKRLRLFISCIWAVIYITMLNKFDDYFVIQHFQVNTTLSNTHSTMRRVMLCLVMLEYSGNIISSVVLT